MSWSLRFNYQPRESVCAVQSLRSIVPAAAAGIFSPPLCFPLTYHSLAVKALHSCLFTAYYNPSLISCLLPMSATLHPPISPPHSTLKLSDNATPPARAADQVTLNICHIMSHALLCNFSVRLGLQMDYCAAASVFCCCSAKTLVKGWGVLLHAFE